jgi:hypothetical protein
MKKPQPITKKPTAPASPSPPTRISFSFSSPLSTLATQLQSLPAIPTTHHPVSMFLVPPSSASFHVLCAASPPTQVLLLFSVLQQQQQTHWQSQLAIPTAHHPVSMFLVRHHQSPRFLCSRCCSSSRPTCNLCLLLPPPITQCPCSWCTIPTHPSFFVLGAAARFSSMSV